MEFIENDEIQSWMSGLNIAFDNYNGLAIHPDRLCTIWSRPEHQESWPHFASSLLMGLDPWDAVVMWPRAGRWLLPPNQIWGGVIIRGDPVPDGWVGGIRFSRGELHAVIAIMFVHFSLGWSMPDDLFLVPDHGQQHLEVSNDDEVYVNFRDASRAEAFVESMTARGYLNRSAEFERDEREEPIVAPCGGIVENGLIRTLDSSVMLPEHARVIIIGI